MSSIHINGKILQAALVDLLDLASQLRQSRWNLVEAPFRPLHLQLDELTNQVRAWADEVAQSIRAIGEVPDGRVATVAATSRLAELPLGEVTQLTVLELLANQVDEVATQIRTQLPELQQDLAAKCLVAGIADRLDTQASMFRMQRHWHYIAPSKGELVTSRNSGDDRP